VIQDHDPFAEVHDDLHIVLDQKDANPFTEHLTNQLHELG